METVSEPRKRVSVRRFVVAVVLLLAVAGVWFIVARRDARSVERKAVTFFEALESRDAEELTGAISSSELAALGMSREKWAQALQDLILPSFEGFHAVGETIAKPQAGNQILLCERVFRHKDGRELRLSMIATDSPTGPQLVSVLQSLVAPALFSRRRPGDPPPVGADRAKFWLSTIRVARPELERLGIPGYAFQNFNDGHYRVSSWDNYLSGLEKQLQKATANKGEQ